MQLSFQPTIRQDMARFDEMPRELRDYLNACPVGFRATDIWLVWKRWGTANTIRIIEEHIRDMADAV